MLLQAGIAFCGGIIGSLLLLGTNEKQQKEKSNLPQNMRGLISPMSCLLFKKLPKHVRSSARLFEPTHDSHVIKDLKSQKRGKLTPSHSDYRTTASNFCNDLSMTNGLKATRTG